MWRWASAREVRLLSFHGRPTILRGFSSLVYLSPELVKYVEPHGQKLSKSYRHGLAPDSAELLALKTSMCQNELLFPQARLTAKSTG